ncbi:hypothetical protein Q3G72_003628 [Acer saccharum]|nr:hypothetical protein Q3G72_003628 [Acer saccharum]
MMELLDGRPHQMGKAMGSYAHYFRKLDTREEKVSGKRFDLEKGKSCWAWKSKLKSRWNPPLNAGVKIGKVRPTHQSSSSYSSTSDTESDRGGLPNFYLVRGECSVKKQFSNQDGVGPLKPNSYIDTQAITDQSAEKVGVLRAHWTDGSDSVEVTHVSLTKSSECPSNEFSDLEASHLEEDFKGMDSEKTNERSIGKPGLNCVWIFMLRERFPVL